MRRSLGIRSRVKSASTTSTWSRRNPASSESRFRRLPTNNRAPTSKTSESATCVTTSARRTETRAPPATMPRPPDFIASIGSVREAWRAGRSPKRTHVSAAIPAVKASRRRSSGIATNHGVSRVLRKETRVRERACASKAPQAAPAAARTRLSARSWRMRRRRDAPRASRTAISRWRTCARATIRLAMFAQAMRSTSAEIPSRSHRGWA